MKTIAEKSTKLPEGFTIDPSLNGKYKNDPFFLKKAEEAKEILRKHPIPDHILNRNKQSK